MKDAKNSLHLQCMDLRRNHKAKFLAKERLTVGTANAMLAYVPLHSLVNPSCTNSLLEAPCDK